MQLLQTVKQFFRRKQAPASAPIETEVKAKTEPVPPPALSPKEQAIEAEIAQLEKELRYHGPRRGSPAAHRNSLMFRKMARDSRGVVTKLPTSSNSKKG